MRTFIIGVQIWLMLLMLSACGKQALDLGRAGLEADMQTCAKLSRKKKFDDAIECLEIVKSRYADRAAASKAELQIADAFFEDKEYLLAAESYEGFLRNHPTHAKAEYALYRMGLSYFRDTPKAIDRDQVHLDEAAQALRNHLRVFPHGRHHTEAKAALHEALGKMGQQHFYVGRLYYRTGEYRAAIPRLEEVVQEYPETPELAKAYHHLVVAYARLGDVENARRAYSAMESAMADNPWTKKAARRVHRVATRAPSRAPRTKE